MARKKTSPYRWTGDPGITQRGELQSDLKSRWDQSTQNNFSEPSRLERQRLRKKKRQRDRVSIAIAGALVILVFTIGVLVMRPHRPAQEGSQGGADGPARPQLSQRTG
jgi:hypothetical protein